MSKLKAKIIKDIPTWIGTQFPELSEEQLIAKEQELYEEGVLIEFEANGQTNTIIVEEKL